MCTTHNEQRAELCYSMPNSSLRLTKLRLEIAGQWSLVSFRKYQSDDRKWVIAANVQHYTTVEKFNANFEAAVVSALDQLELQIDDDRSEFTIAETDRGHRIGCVFFAAESKAAGRLRLFYLAATHRGHGVGKLMLRQIIEKAQAIRLLTIRVSTFDRHKQACGLYASLGFRRKTSEPIVAYGQRMRRVDFELILPAYSA